MHDDDGDQPLLPSPPPEALKRAERLFGRLLHEMRAAPQTPPITAEAPRVFGGTRRYDVALSLLPQVAPAQSTAAGAGTTQAKRGVATHAPFAAYPTQSRPSQSMLPDLGEAWAEEAGAAGASGAAPQALGDESTRSAEDSALEPTTIGDPLLSGQAPLPAHPPSGAPTVRKAAPPAVRPSDALPPMALHDETALLRTEADGGMAFDLILRDATLGELACTIAVNEGRATATFTVNDVNTRRLLEAEAPKLRQGLEARGLKVADIKVVLVGR